MRTWHYKITHFFISIGDFTVFSCKALYSIFKPPFRFKQLVEQLMQIGISSIGVIGISSVAIGMIFTLQLVIELQKFNSATLIGNILGQVFTRELSPVFTSLMLIGKNGSSITAQLGSMSMSNQLHAMRIMSVDTTQYLVVPRLLAFMYMFPMLSATSTLLGLGGAAYVAFGMLDVDYAITTNYMFKQLTVWDISSGILKCLVMGIFTCLICCYLGMKEKHNSNEIARRTTQAVVYSSVGILIIDFFMGKLFILIGVTN